MKRGALFIGLAALAAAASVVRPAAAQGLPPPRTVEFNLRQSPQDPLSPVVGVVTAHITPTDRVENQVAWQISEVEVRVVGSDGQTQAVWKDTAPAAGKEAWWVAHADAAAPQPEEFVETPLLVGTADATEGTTAALDYEFASTLSASTLYDGRVADASYNLALETAPEEPIAGGDGEPVETSGDGQPS